MKPRCYVLSAPSSFESLRRVGTAAALLGHWVAYPREECDGLQICRDGV